MGVHSVKPRKGNCIWMTNVSKGLFTETVHYVVLRALSQDVLSVLRSPRLSSKQALWHRSEGLFAMASFGHRSHTHLLPLVKSFSAAPLLHFPKPLAIPPPPQSPLCHLGYCPPFSPFMLLTLLRNVVFLAWKGQRARLTERCWTHGFHMFSSSSLTLLL